jgi:hypothetical protein
MTVSRDQGNVWALSSVLFAASFILGDVLLGVLAQVPLPLPDAPATDVVRFYEASRAAALAQGFVQILSAVSLFVFVAPVATFVRRIAAERRALVGLTSGGDTLAAIFLLVSRSSAWYRL